MAQKSPFLIIQEIISPKQCEDIIYQLNSSGAIVDNSITGKLSRFNSLLDVRLSDQVSNLIESTESYYNYQCEYFSKLNFEFFPSGYKATQAHCENSIFNAGKWTRIRDIDFTAVIFLNDFQPNIPFDPEFELVGGKLEFPNHGFGFNPKRGEAIIFPSNQFFLNGTSSVLLGSLNQIRLQLTSTTPFIYNKEDFEGNYKSWFPKVN